MFSPQAGGWSSIVQYKNTPDSYRDQRRGNENARPNRTIRSGGHQQDSFVGSTERLICLNLIVHPRRGGRRAQLSSDAVAQAWSQNVRTFRKKKSSDTLGPSKARLHPMGPALSVLCALPAVAFAPRLYIVSAYAVAKAGNRYAIKLR